MCDVSLSLEYLTLSWYISTDKSHIKWNKTSPYICRDSIMGSLSRPPSLPTRHSPQSGSCSWLISHVLWWHLRHSIALRIVYQVRKRMIKFKSENRLKFAKIHHFLPFRNHSPCVQDAHVALPLCAECGVRCGPWALLPLLDEGPQWSATNGNTFHWTITSGL